MTLRSDRDQRRYMEDSFPELRAWPPSTAFSAIAEVLRKLAGDRFNAVSFGFNAATAETQPIFTVYLHSGGRAYQGIGHTLAKAVVAALAEVEAAS